MSKSDSFLDAESSIVTMGEPSPTYIIDKKEEMHESNVEINELLFSKLFYIGFPFISKASRRQKPESW